jgi:hypothetical protein
MTLVNLRNLKNHDLELVFKFFNMDKYEYEKSIISQTGTMKLSDRKY